MERIQAVICEFCGKTFKGEATFKKHHCKQMDRFKQFDENAFELYVAWQKGARECIKPIQE